MVCKKKDKVLAREGEELNVAFYVIAGELTVTVRDTGTSSNYHYLSFQSSLLSFCLCLFTRWNAYYHSILFHFIMAIRMSTNP